MDKYKIATDLIKKNFKVGEFLYLIDGMDKNPIYLVWDIDIDKYVIVTYYKNELRTVFQMKSTENFVEVWNMLICIMSAYEKHNE